MKTKIFMLFALCTALLAGCATDESEGNNSDINLDELEETWGDDLTLEQVIQTMPLTVTAIAPDAAAGIQTNGIIQNSAVDDTASDVQAVMVEWTIPVRSCYAWGCEVPGIWKIFEQDDNGDWVTIDVEPTWTYNKYRQSTITYSFNWNFSWRSQFLKYFKVQMPDHNTGALYENIVTFMVCPKDNPIEITLVEASADAPSELFVEYGYDDVQEELFIVNDGSLRELVLPQSAPLTTEVLPANEPIKFTIRTDFSELGFEEDISVHQSNSSYCKVTKINQGLPSDVQWRFKFAFEDLPLDKKAIEDNGLFDYNDLVFFVDIMKL